MPTLEEKLALARQQMGKEMPDVANKVDIQPYGAWEKMTSSPTATATTSPFTGNVFYNPNVMGQRSQEDINSDLAHELTHSRQVLNQGPIDRGISVLKNLFTSAGPYETRPNEIEARQTELDRTLNQHIPQAGDINLPLSGLKKVR